MKKFYALLLICTPLADLMGQTITTIMQTNFLRTRFLSNGLFTPSPGGGSIFINGPSSLPGMLYSGGLWLGGLHEGMDLRLAAHMYGADGHDFYPGPLTNDGSATITEDMSDAYDQIWRISNYQVVQHREYFDCLNDPDCDVSIEFPNGYEIPGMFLQWPAIGDVNNGQDMYIAPFVDVDGDGDYNPASGDHPCVPGDEALFMVFNDMLGEHMESGGTAMGVEVQMMPFAYDLSSGIDLGHTVFVHYKIINRSTETLSNFYISNFSDFDLGCSNDDNVGTDVARNMIYVYNGDEDDEDCLGAYGFGTQPPAFGMVVLKGPLMDPNGSDDAASGTLPSINGSGFGDGIIDNERHGLSRTMHFRREGNPQQTEPGVPTDLYRYQRSIWKNGIPLSHGGSGYSEDPGAIPSLFAFPGDSDPNGAGTGGDPMEPWYDTYNAALPDPRMVASMGPFTFEPGEVQEILIAYVFAGAAEGGAMASVEALQQRVDVVRTFAETIPGIMNDGENCDHLALGLHDRVHEAAPLSIHPNPASQIITLNFDREQQGQLRIFDARGSMVHQQRIQRNTTTIDVAALPAGLYQVHFEGSEVVRVGRFVKE